MVPPQGTVRLCSYGNSASGGDGAQHRVDLIGVEPDQVRANPIRGQVTGSDATTDSARVDLPPRGDIIDGDELVACEICGHGPVLRKNERPNSTRNL